MPERKRYTGVTNSPNRATRRYTLRGKKGVRKVTAGAKAKKVTVRGRPPTREMPEPIDAPPERVAEIVLQAKPKRTWRYMEQARKRPSPGAEG